MLGCGGCSCVRTSLVGCVESGKVYENEVALARVEADGGFALNLSHVVAKGGALSKTEAGLKNANEGRPWP